MTYKDKRPKWSRKTLRNADFVFYHNDLSQHNIFVDPNTFEITSIIDWEFAGFYTENFEYPL
jgi:aminoglycoside phosphotransferase (APT) family kinase protein